MENPRFSLITITLNAEKYLEEALASAKGQESASFEHIVWDGGSTDRTLEIVRSFPHVTLLQGKDQGISDAMNHAAKSARGQFLHFLHADDRLSHSKVLATIDTALSQHRCQWLYGQVRLIDEKGNLKSAPPFVPFEHRKLRKYNIISHPATVVSRSLFDEVSGFDSSLRYCMDYDLWLRLAGRATPFALAAVLAEFREHSGSISTALPIQVADEAYAVRRPHMRSLLERYRSWRTWKRRRAGA